MYELPIEAQSLRRLPISDKNALNVRQLLTGDNERNLSDLFNLSLMYWYYCNPNKLDFCTAMKYRNRNSYHLN